MFGKKEASEGLKREHYSDKIVKYRLHRLGCTRAAWFLWL